MIRAVMRNKISSATCFATGRVYSATNTKAQSVPGLPELSGALLSAFVAAPAPGQHPSQTTAPNSGSSDNTND
jgi:hypothetical protein